jgi:hypothetical protein
MNKSLTKKKRPAKASRTNGARKPAVRTARSRSAARKPEPPTPVMVAAVSVTQIVARSSGLRTHKYRVGQTVFYTSSPISRPGASGSYEVVKLLPSDGDDYQYRIKNPGEAFERVAKESQLELDR